MERSQAYYRHHRNRVIQRKLDIVKNVWGAVDGDGNEDHPWAKEPGRLDKARMNCSCKMCKYEKHYDVPKASLKSKWDVMGQEIEEYFKEN
ncbi:hypothetical protein IMZ31_05290 [Pontibacillus sp. ALD_SL1]|uniref:hypothetical protein n=1 Tax=Pontibacillus sp. ALD_SL1 TaxID=2777185 RepID=UPI001A9744FE|nr:hypothetical protein [Pontibacillus sp. ALD_SL1]QST00987.1 hypothetical protein IMZ31_05290 [Pontibacillus sp. ALD_SL1]